MKIGDVVVGKEYGALDSPKSSGYSRVDPRKVKVLEIVTQEENTYSAYTKKKVRRVKVQVLDGPDKPLGSWRYDKIKKSAKNDTLVIEARQLVGEWKDIHPQIRERIAAEERTADITKRLKSAGFKIEWGEVSISTSSFDSRGAKIEFKGKSVEKLLKLLGV